MRRLARCLALIVIEITYLQIKCTDMKAPRVKFGTIQNVTVTMRTCNVKTSHTIF